MLKGMGIQLTQRRGGKLGRFPNEIRRYRIQSGFTQRELAAHLGRGRSIVSTWERGHSLPSLRNAFRLAKALGTLTEALYEELYSPPEESGVPQEGA